MAKKNRQAELTLTTRAPSSGSVSSKSSNGASSLNYNNAQTNKVLKTTSSSSSQVPNKSSSKPQSILSNHNAAQDDASVVSSLPEDDEIVVKSQSPPWKQTFDYIADQAFNVIGAAYLSCMMAGAIYFLKTQTDINFWQEFWGGTFLMIFHKKGILFFGILFFMIGLRWIINEYVYPRVLNTIYEGKNHKYTAHYCEWFFDAVKNTLLFCMGAYVAFGSDWWPVPQKGCLLWYPPQGGTVFDANGEIVPTKDLALEIIGRSEVTVDFVALLTLIYDAATEYYEAKYAPKMRHGEEQNQAATTTSFAEDFVHHTGVCMGALFLYIVAKDNANSIAIIVLLGQFNDMCEFAALVLGLCKNWFLERVVTPVLCVFWTVSLFYIWPACLLPIFLEAIPVEHSFDMKLVIQMTLYQVGSLFIAGLFWAMHMFWLYKGLLFLYRYNRGVYFAEKKIKCRGEKAAMPVPMYGRTACVASGTFLKPTKEE